MAAPVITPKLFQPIQVGAHTLSHRVVLAPLTRGRADTSFMPGPNVKEYYAQRASTPGTLLISKATYIAAKAGLDSHIPGF